MSEQARDDDVAVRPPPQAIVYWALLAIAAAGFCLHACIYWDWTEDDAFISYRYAQQLVAGEGLVFNPGERVEGYSNFTWVILAAAGIRVGLDPIALSKTVGLLLGLSCLFLSWVLARRVLPRIGLTALLAPVYLAASPLLVRHSVSGLETSLFSLLLLAAILAASTVSSSSVRRSLVLVVLLFVLSMTRPEGPAVAGVLLLMRVFAVSRQDIRPERIGDRGSFRLVGVECVLYLVLFGAYYLWRGSYFGAPFANTYYAKTSGGLHGVIDGVQYTLGFLRDSGGVWFMGLVLVPLFVGRTRPIYAMCLAVLASYVAFVIAVGGDWMYHYRFYAHVVPVWAALIAVGIGRLQELARAGMRTRLVYAAFALLLLTTFMSVGNSELRIARIVLPSVKAHTYLSQNYEKLGFWFRENSDPNATIAISDIGALAYYSERRILDMFGLVDRHIARLPGRMHYKADPRYVLSREPDYIVLVSQDDQGAGNSFQRVPDYRMNALPGFHQQYELIRTVPQHWQNEFALVYRRKG